MSNIEDCVNKEINNLRKYVEKINYYLSAAVKNEQTLGEGKEKRTIYLERKEKYKMKGIHGKFSRVTKDSKDEKMWVWLKKSGAKKETVGLLMVAEVQAIRTKYFRRTTDKDINSTCRLW